MELARGSIENPVRMNGIVCIFRLKRKKYLLSTIMFWSRIYPFRTLKPVSGTCFKKNRKHCKNAALFQYFSYGEGKISADIMTSAVVISSWYTDEYKKLFALPDESELQQKDAEELFDWLIEECRGEMPARVRKNYILQCGPGRFRNRKKLNALLNILESQFRLSVVPEGKTMYVLLPQIASLKLSDVSGIFTSGYHYNKLRAK
ncbi:CP4-57 prophage protein [Escherichia coli]|uniref:CP4-57 prophage protein n=1 Tax=Escherichia coli TaxID=562 RepID=A0A376YG85_ECOLX|nr:CP4-57 prophage protein [Escherichia coli]